MTISVGSSFVHELRTYGLTEGLGSCYNCGTCSTVCASQGQGISPRIIIRYLQLGLREEIIQNEDIWNCSACGICTKNCPRGADPLSIILALREWVSDQN